MRGKFSTNQVFILLVIQPTPFLVFLVCSLYCLLLLIIRYSKTHEQLLSPVIIEDTNWDSLIKRISLYYVQSMTESSQLLYSHMYKVGSFSGQEQELFQGSRTFGIQSSRQLLFSYCTYLLHSNSTFALHLLHSVLKESITAILHQFRQDMEVTFTISAMTRASDLKAN